MQRRPVRTALAGGVTLLAATLGMTQLASSGADGAQAAQAAQAAQSPSGRPAVAQKATVPTGFRDVTVIGGLSQPVAAAFAPDGTAFVAMQTGEIKSFDYDSKTQQFEAPATATEFADLTGEVDNYGDRGLTGITVDPQFPARPYVYVDYTLNADPQQPTAIPAWGTPGQAYDNCGPNDSGEATLSPPKRGCPVLDRVSRLTAQRTGQGWAMTPGSELVLVEGGCAQFSSHSSGDVAFGPDGMLYASAGDGASYKGQDYGQANVGSPAYPQGPACPGDPTDEGGALRAQDERTSGDPLSIDGTIFRLNPDTPLNPTQATASQWLVAMGQRNPWRFTFRQGKEQLWSVDVGSSNWEEINYLSDARTAALQNRGWPCYEGANGQSVRNDAWDALNKPLCESLYGAGAGAVQPPVFSYQTTNATRTATVPLTPGENCPSKSSSISGVAFAPLGTDWPAAYQDSLFFSDFQRGCIWRLGKDQYGQPDPASIHVFAQAAGAPVQVLPGPGGDLFYVDYGLVNGQVVPGGGGVHRLDYVGPTRVAVKSSPVKIQVKVGGRRHKTPYRIGVDPGTTLKLVAPRVTTTKGVRYVFTKWKGVHGKKAKRRKLKLKVGLKDLSVKAVYTRERRP